MGWLDRVLGSGAHSGETLAVPAVGVCAPAMPDADAGVPAIPHGGRPAPLVPGSDAAAPDAAAPRAFRMEDVTVGYHARTVLEHVALEVRPGEVHCLLGPNGVGKTTLFRSALGLIPVLGGRITVDGLDAVAMGDRELARHVAYVPQASEAPFAFTVRDVVAMGRIARMGAFSSPGVTDYAVVDATLERLGMARLAARAYTELSGGERQMALIARAVAQEPGYLMMDEPTAALDLGNQAQVLSCVRELADAGMGVLMTTHVPDHVQMLGAAATLIMRDGSFVQGGAAEVLDEGLLSRAYGCEVMAVDAAWRGRSMRFCRPAVG